jgi:HEPN domain-containing protein
MDDSYVDKALTNAETAFRATSGQTGESHLDVSDATLVQLRKACRLLEAARTLREQNGYYTVVIEASFVAIERSIQFYLLHRGHASGEDLRYEHTEVYQQGAEINLFSEAFADRLTQLWKQNRAEVYYRETVASAEQADSMLALAEAVHRYVLDFASLQHECVCPH